MYIFLRKILYSTCLSSLESPLRPGTQKLMKLMSFSRRLSDSRVTDVCSFDYNHRAQGSGSYNFAVYTKSQRDSPVYSVNYFKPIDVNCGELRPTERKLIVHMTGRVQFQRLSKFLSLRDSHGTTQLVILEERLDIMKQIRNIPADSHIEIIGTVQLRPKHTINVKMSTGEIEVIIDQILDVFAPKRKLNEISGEEASEHVIKKARSLVPMTSEELTKCGGVNTYCTRTHTCGELRGSDIEKEVVLCGWLASQRSNRFAHIRDGHGSTQLIVQSGLEHTVGKILSQTPLESVIMVSGTVCARPPEQIKDIIGTGEIEVVVKEFKVLNPAKKDLPFIIRKYNRPKENMRMKYRYLDLRFEDMQYKLRLRSKVLMQMREFLINHRGFVEVETPTLFRRTPGGAQEYVVPTRTEGKFYSLVQSPQQLKQLLMIGCMDRYFQVARCYRDEGARPDRQPEFTQMDIELSFTNKEQIMSLIEDLLRASFPDKLTTHKPFPVITYQEAMHWYGSDKPDLSFDKKLIDISELIENNDLLPENVRDVKGFTAKVLVFDSSCHIQKLKDSICDCEDAKKLKGVNNAKMLVVKCSENWKQDVEKTLPFLDAEKFKNTIEFPIPSTIIVGIGQENEILPLMGKLRNAIFRKPTSDIHFVWIVDFPLFLEQDDGTLESAHHPFTQAHEQDVHLLESEPLKVRGLHFDLVLNGYEVGGGSVRIHDPVLQTKVLKDILKIRTDSLQHLLEALASGAPPHGGIALGIDRLMSIMVGADTIREVIAFPKGVDGKDPMCGAPCTISDEEKQLYHLIPTSPK